MFEYFLSFFSFLFFCDYGFIVFLGLLSGMLGVVVLRWGSMRLCWRAIIRPSGRLGFLIFCDCEDQGVEVHIERMGITGDYTRNERDSWVFPEHSKIFLSVLGVLRGCMDMSTGHIFSLLRTHASNESFDSPHDQFLKLISFRSSDSHLSLQKYYEVVGKVTQLDGGHGLGIRVLGTTEWVTPADSPAVDMKAYEAVVEATHRWKEIFYEGGDE